MRIKDTLIPQEISGAIFGDEPCGIFINLFEHSDLLYKYRLEYSKGYYFAHSANKIVSPYYEYILGIDGVDDSLNANSIIAHIIRDKFNHKWEKIYTALYEEYSSINEFILDEKYNHTFEDKKTKSGTEENNNQYNHSMSDIGSENGSSSSKNTRSDDTSESTSYKSTESVNNDTTINSVWGFNSNDAIDSDKSVNNSAVVVERNINDNKVVTDGTIIDDYEDANSKSYTSNIIKNNTDTLNRETSEEEETNKTGEYTKSKTGRDTSAQSLINEEIELRVKHIIEDIIYKDIDSILTLPIYI